MLDARNSRPQHSIWEALVLLADRTLNRMTARIRRWEHWADVHLAPTTLIARADAKLTQLTHRIHTFGAAVEVQTALAYEEVLALTADWRTLPVGQWHGRWQEYGQIEWQGLLEAIQQIIDVGPQWARLVWWDVLPPLQAAWQKVGGSTLFWLMMSANGLAGFMVLVMLAANSSGQPASVWRGNFQFPVEARGAFSMNEAAPPVAAVPTATPIPTATPEPVLTATPIPIPTAYPSWESTLPQYGGWNGGGECWGPVAAPVGSGYFVWPTDHHVLVGRNYSYWHPGLDLGGNLGDPLYASDSGAVVYSGWNNYGYGNLVIIDHGNGWHTLYAHFNEIYVACGEAVTQGQVIGAAGTTGNSTGPHLHFEMRYNGGYVSPWNYLP